MAALLESGTMDSGHGDAAEVAATAAAPPLPIHMPRDYQLSLFRQALSSNSIVMLETGTGKTLVAVMLIQRFAQRAQDLQAAAAPAGTLQARRKVRVFLNTTVALVHQQARVIAANTDQTVIECIGAMGIDEWDEQTWSAKWSSAGVLVMTHQVLLNALRSGFVRISDIDLLVFDECHHARGNHPYTLIMREFYDHCREADRPHIFGMTASPLNARQTAETSVAHLQASLDAGICTVDLTAASGATLSTPTGICYEYKLPPEFDSTPLTVALIESCGPSKVIARGQRASPAILSLLGPFAVDQMWIYYIRHWHRAAILRPAPNRQLFGGVYARAPAEASTAQAEAPTAQAESEAEPGAETDLNAGVDACSGSDADVDDKADAESGANDKAEPSDDTQQSAAMDVEIDILQDIACLKRAMAIVREHGKVPTSTGAIRADADADSGAGAGAALLAGGWDHPVPQIRALAALRRPWDELRGQLTPQVNRLLGILQQWRDQPENLRGIVFTSRRITAVLLVYIVSQIAEFDYIKADVLLGSSQKASGNVDRPIRGGSVRVASQLTLADFAAGKLNLVFATQVAEEGVDIQPCNLVIRFDMPKTATSLIQSRGRARMADSQFIVMVPEISTEQRMAMEREEGEAPVGSAVPVIPCAGDDSVAGEEQRDAPLAWNGAMEVDGGSPATKRQLLPEHAGTYTDYLKLVNLEECLREWCRGEAQVNNSTTSDGVIISNRRHKEYDRALLGLRSLLRVDSSSDTSLKEVWVEQGDRAGRVYIIVATQARITYMSAISIVYTYVQRLPQDMYCKLTPVITFEEVLYSNTDDDPPGNDPAAMTATAETAEDAGGVTVKKPSMPKTLFRCTFTLPSNAAIRRVSGPLMPNKKIAKQAAAYRTAKKLHQIGAIDDNLTPVVETVDDVEPSIMPVPKRDPKRGPKAVKGARASTDVYKIATASYFLPPTVDGSSGSASSSHSASNQDATSTAEQAPTDLEAKGDCSPAAEYRPIPWHVYLVSLKHPQSAAPTLIALVTVNRLPEDIEMPLFVQQYAKGSGAADASQTVIQPVYLGSQVLDQAQVDILASFSSQLLVRVLHMAMVYEVSEIGCLVAPMLADGTGIDLAFAEACFADRSIAYSSGQASYQHLVGTLVMDGLDGGHIKLVERTCDDLDIYSDVRRYHLQHSAGGLATPSGATSSGAGGTEGHSACSAEWQDAQPSKKRQRYGEKSKMSVRSLADWSAVKRMTRLLPPKGQGAGVPLLKVKYVSPALNYLVVAPTNLAGADEEPAASPAALAKAPEAFPDGFYTSPFFCASEPMALDDLHSLSLLPSLFARLEQLLLAEDVRSRLNLPARRESVREALTASSASADVNYERLETLGDAVLKYITTVMVFVAFPDAHEGILTSRRGRIICNAHLFDLAINIGLPPYILSQLFVKRDVRLPGKGWRRLPFIPGKWICCSPFVKSAGTDASSKEAAAKPGEEPSSAPKRAPVVPLAVCDSRTLSEKTIADTVESLLGACMRDSGLEGALTAARALGVVDDTWASWSTFANMWQSSVDARRQKMARLSSLRNEMIAAARIAEEAEALLLEVELDQSDVIYGPDACGVAGVAAIVSPERQLVANIDESTARNVESVLGYTFRDRALLTEALTHCSSLSLESKSYQRLEFLGDAVLDFLITQRYYDFQPALTPHRMTLVKHIAASNDLFAVALVCNGLHRFIRYNSPIIRNVLYDYEARLDRARQVWAEGQDSAEVGSEHDADTSVDGAACRDGEATDGADDELPHKSDIKRSARPSSLQAPANRPEIRHKASGGRGAANDIYKDLPPESWNIVQAPKILGDIFESLVGAIYVDSGMDHDTARRVYERLLCPFLDRFVDTGKLSLHPVIQCLLICQGWGCTVITWSGRAGADQLEFKEKYVCDVQAHGQTIATSTGESPRHARYNATSAFLQKIGAVVPNAIDGNMNTMHSLPTVGRAADGTEESTLDKLLKPICNCAERRQEEAEARAAAEEAKHLDEKATADAAGAAADGVEAAAARQADDTIADAGLEEGEIA